MSALLLVWLGLSLGDMAASCWWDCHPSATTPILLAQRTHPPTPSFTNHSQLPLLPGSSGPLVHPYDFPPIPSYPPTQYSSTDPFHILTLTNWSSFPTGSKPTWDGPGCMVQSPSPCMAPSRLEVKQAFGKWGDESSFVACTYHHLSILLKGKAKPFLLLQASSPGCCSGYPSAWTGGAS